MQGDDAESLVAVQTEIVWSEFVALSGFSESEVQDLVDFGLLTPVSQDSPLVFAPALLHITQRAHRLRNDFELPPLALDLVFDLLTKIEHLERELHAFKSHQSDRIGN